MSSSAGKVLLRPRGEYNAATEYKILDWVLYNGRPYVAKQTTTGNLPTNTTYWQILLDFPTEVDNVPTQNSPNLVRSGGVYDATATKMEKDGSNANNVRIGYNPSNYNQSTYYYVNTITKAAGTGQSLIMTRTVSHGSSMPVEYYETLYKIRINAPESLAYRENNVFVPFVIDSVTTTTGTTEDTITITAHLQEDVTDAIDLGEHSIYIKFLESGEYNLIVGSTNINGDHNILNGESNSILGSNSFASGSYNVINGDNAIALGESNYIGAFDGYAIGRRLKTQTRDQVVVGTFNDNKANTVFEVGSGGATRDNAFEVYSDGSISCDDGESLFRFTKNGGKHGYYDEAYSVFHPFQESLYLTKSVTLSTSADTTTTFSNAAITTDSMIDVYTDTYGINPTNVSVAAGSCTLTFAKASTAQTISVRIEIKNV